MFGKILRAFKRMRADVQYAKAVEKAENALLASGQRHYVIKGVGEKGKHQLVITDRANFKMMKVKGYINRSLRIADLERICFYCTSYANGDGYMEDWQKERGKARAIKWMSE